ncbi:MAG: hypothetical protein V1944_00445 [Candidatus Aenigmatarchaeota archaeon]
MIGKLFVVCMIIVLVILVYEFVHNVWNIDICLSYYQTFGNYNFTIPFSNNRTNTWDCYHQALNDLFVYMLGIVVISIFLGMAIRDFKE